PTIPVRDLDVPAVRLRSVRVGWCPGADVRREDVEDGVRERAQLPDEARRLRDGAVEVHEAGRDVVDELDVGDGDLEEEVGWAAASQAVPDGRIVCRETLDLRRAEGAGVEQEAGIAGRGVGAEGGAGREQERDPAARAEGPPGAPAHIPQARRMSAIRLSIMSL